eukprot:6191584-Pleurochrysis_carterae.AAC.3
MAPSTPPHSVPFESAPTLSFEPPSMRQSLCELQCAEPLLGDGADVSAELADPAVGTANGAASHATVAMEASEAMAQLEAMDGGA